MKYDAAMKAGVLGEIGADRGSAPSGPEAELTKAAEELRKSNTKLTPEQAFARATELNPGLYAAMLTGSK